MKCSICGKEVEAESFCSRCGTYAVGTPNEESAPHCVEAEALHVKRRVACDVYLSTCKLNLAIYVVLVLFISAFFVVFVLHRMHDLQLVDIIILSLTITFFAIALLRLSAYAYILRFFGAIQRSGFSLAARQSAGTLRCVTGGCVYSLALRKPYSVVKRNGGTYIEAGDKRYRIDLQKVEALVQREKSPS